MKIKLFTHTDLDGVACAILGIIAFGKSNIDVEYCDYNDINEKVKQFIINKEYNNYDFVYITDISINEEVAELIDNTQPDTFKEGFCLGEMFQLLDHHPTALWLNKYFWANVKIYNNPNIKDFKTSGAYMFKEYLVRSCILNNINCYNFANVVRKYDTWEWKETNDIIPKRLNDLFYILGRERFIDNYTETLNSNKNIGLKGLFNLADLLLLPIEQEKIDRYIKNKSKNVIIKEIQGYKAGIVFAEQYHSELGNRLSEIRSDLDFIIIINMSRGISYRTTKDNINLGKIAKVYGGGGHPKSAGSSIDDRIKQDLIDALFKVDKVYFNKK